MLVILYVREVLSFILILLAEVSVCVYAHEHSPLDDCVLFISDVLSFIFMLLAQTSVYMHMTDLWNHGIPYLQA